MCGQTDRQTDRQNDKPSTVTLAAHARRGLITHIYIEDNRTKKVSECAVTSEQSVLIKIANSNFVPTLRGFRWYPFFVAQEQLVAFEASK